MYSPPQELIDQIKRHEGVRLESYRCPAGKISVGVGHNLEANPIPGIPATLGIRINAEQAERLLIADLIDFRKRILAKLPWATDLDTVRFCALINLAFNVGIGSLLGFRKMLAALEDGSYVKAATEALDSAWGRGEVLVHGDKVILPGLKARALEVANQIATGEWQEVA